MFSKKLGYCTETQALIDRMCRYVERDDFELKKKEAQELVLKTYDLFNLPRPKTIVWVKDISDKTFENSAGSAGSARNARNARNAWSARSAGSAGSARNARSAWSARSAGSAWSARNARNARNAWSAWSAGSAGNARSAWSARSAGSARSWTALDYDFDWFVIEYEYCKHPSDEKPNKNDRVYLSYCDLLIQALEAGVGYRVEWEDTLYLAPTPIVRIDGQNRFHSLTEPAIRWKGGHEFYFVNGVSVSKKIIKTPEKLTKKDWMNETNQEVRRVIQERMGEKFIKAIGSKEIHKSDRGVLVEVDISPDPEEIARYVQVQDASTSRQYYLRVPPTVRTADEAVAWTFGLDVEIYKPTQQT